MSDPHETDAALDKLLGEVDARWAKATPRPWSVVHRTKETDGSPCDEWWVDFEVVEHDSTLMEGEQGSHDANAIAAAPDDIHDLRRAIDELRAERAEAATLRASDDVLEQARHVRDLLAELELAHKVVEAAEDVLVTHADLVVPGTGLGHLHDAIARYDAAKASPAPADTSRREDMTPGSASKERA